MIDEICVYAEEDGWHLQLQGELIPDGADLVPGTLDVRVDPQLLDDALAQWRAHEAEGRSVRAEYEASGRVSYAEAHAVDDTHERARELADAFRDRARGK